MDTAIKLAEQFGVLSTIALLSMITIIWAFKSLIKTLQSTQKKQASALIQQTNVLRNIAKNLRKQNKLIVNNQVENNKNAGELKEAVELSNKGLTNKIEKLSVTAAHITLGAEDDSLS